MRWFEWSLFMQTTLHSQKTKIWDIYWDVYIKATRLLCGGLSDRYLCKRLYISSYSRLLIFRTFLVLVHKEKTLLWDTCNGRKFCHLGVVLLLAKIPPINWAPPFERVSSSEVVVEVREDRHEGVLKKYKIRIFAFKNLSKLLFFIIILPLPPPPPLIPVLLYGEPMDKDLGHFSETFIRRIPCYAAAWLIVIYLYKRLYTSRWYSRLLIFRAFIVLVHKEKPLLWDTCNGRNFCHLSVYTFTNIPGTLTPVYKAKPLLWDACNGRNFCHLVGPRRRWSRAIFSAYFISKSLLWNLECQ